MTAATLQVRRGGREQQDSLFAEIERLLGRTEGRLDLELQVFSRPRPIGTQIMVEPSAEPGNCLYSC